MIKMQTIKSIIRRVLAPVTIMFIPHHNSGKSLHLSIPAIGVVLSGILCGCGAVYLTLATIDMLKYREVERQVKEYAAKVSDFNATLVSLKKAEQDLHRLLSLGSREKILEAFQPSDMGTADVGAFDTEHIQQQITLSMQAIGSIQDFLSGERDIYIATPKGWPAPGWVSSPFGRRVNPITGRAEFHNALDISVPAGTPIQATADGVVTFSGWSGGGGNAIVIEHGFGYSTLYAHNKRNAVEVGQQVKRGEVIGYAGATGSATGSHVHYEVWREGRAVNPRSYVQGRS